MATLSLKAIYNYDPSIFDGFSVPSLGDLPSDMTVRDNAPLLSKDTAIEKIVFDTMGMSLVYTDPDDLKQAITTWTKVYRPIWVDLYQTVCFKYNAIWNKDAHITETHDGNYHNENEGTGTHNVTGYDSTSFSPDTQDVGSGSNDGNDHYTDTREEVGNIGITSTQELIQKSRDIAGFSIYEYISNSFKNAFCVMVY